jgi:hypothetical protein
MFAYTKEPSTQTDKCQFFQSESELPKAFSKYYLFPTWEISFTPYNQLAHETYLKCRKQSYPKTFRYMTSANTAKFYTIAFTPCLQD